jgi:deferrochelatase/peroxidase EfeB
VDSKLIIPIHAHIRHASPSVNNGVRILRRGYSFVDGADPVSGALDAGLFFLAFQRNPHTQFAVIQQRLHAHDALRRYIEHTASAVFAVPGGVKQSETIAARLFDN